MYTKVLTPMTRRCKRSVSSPRSILNGVSLLSAFFGVLFLKFAAGLNSSFHMDDGKPLSASMYRTMVHRVPPTHSNTPRFCGVLVATKSLIMPVSKQYCRKSSPVYSPPVEATEDHAFVFVNK